MNTRLVIRQKITLFTITVFITACSTFSTQPPPPSPAPLHVVYSPAVRLINQALDVCVQSGVNAAIFRQERSMTLEDMNSADLILRLGYLDSDQAYAIQLAEEKIIIVTNPENPAESLGENELREILLGRTLEWSPVGDVIQVWDYPEGDDLHQLIVNEFLNGERITSMARLAPNPAAMLEAVSENPGAIGYLPAAWMSPGVKEIEITQGMLFPLHIPLMAITHGEPDSALRQLLACLQSGAGQEVIPEIYNP